TALRPRLPSIDRDRVLFSAGFHSAHRKIWIWRSAAGSLAAMLLVSVFIRPQAPSTQPTPNRGGSNAVFVNAQQKSRPSTTAPLEVARNRWMEALWSLGKDPSDAPAPANFLAVRRAGLDRNTVNFPIPAGNEQQPPLRLVDPADQSVYQL